MNRAEWLEQNQLNLDNWHDFLITQIDDAITNGLPKVYGDDVRAYLADVWVGDIPWTEEAQVIVFKNLEADERWPEIQAGFIKWFGVDFVKAIDQEDL